MSPRKADPTFTLKAPQREPDVAGQYMGVLKVIGVVGRKWVSNGRANWLLWAVECAACGEQDVLSSNVIYSARKGHHQNFCRRCAAGGNADAQSVRLPDGRSIREIAKAAGLKHDTVYHRYIRGWPHDQLGAKPLPVGQARPGVKKGRAA